MNILKIIVGFVLLVLMGGCATESQRQQDVLEGGKTKGKLGEYMYLEFKEGAICHIDAKCGKDCTYIRTDQVISSVKERKNRGEYYRTGSAAYDATCGNYQFCSECIPIYLMKEIDERTQPTK